ncbi:MAG: glycosyltransferase family 4 protein [Candidatus Vogelbacteria bacterium]|nr:glycosyltransferase family 4 protein [Candidatus Vogelbacteria bacterium]
MHEKTKILYVITKSNWGGAQKYIFELAINLPKDKFDVAVVLGGNGVLAGKLQKEHIKTINLPSLERDINFFREFIVLFDLIKIFRHEKPNIIHLNSSKIGGLGSLAGRIYPLLKNRRSTPNPKIVFTAHGFAFNEDRPKIVKMILFILNYITILWSHKVIIINEHELNQVKSLPFIQRKLELIHLGVRPITGLRVNKDIGSPVAIGTISELTKNKGLQYVIEAIARLKNKNITFTIIGEGEERNHLTSLIYQNNIADKVQLLGFKESATSYLNLFDIFTLTSVKEGLPYSILEAGLAGLPVVASNVGGIGEIIKKDKSGIFVEPKYVELIVVALSQLIDSPTLRKTFGQNLKKTVEQKFSIEQMIEKTKALYEK